VGEKEEESLRRGRWSGAEGEGVGPRRGRAAPAAGRDAGEGRPRERAGPQGMLKLGT
jgi:hypothetical protein